MTNYFSNNRWAIWTIIALVILNLFTLSMLWWSNKNAPNSRAGENMPHKERIENFIAKQLNLTDQQKEQFSTLRKNHREQTKTHFDKMRSLRQQRMDALTTTPPDTTKVNQLARQIGNQQALLEATLSEHYYQLQALCNEDQKAKLADVFQKMMERRKKRGKRRR